MITPAVRERPVYAFKPSRYSSHHLLLESLPAQGGGLRVLDVGCAAGYLSEILARRGFDVTAIDLPHVQPPPSVEFIGADLNQGLPPLGGRFDYIICADVLEHLRDSMVLLLDFQKVLAPGGKLLASLPNSGHLYFRWNVLMGRFPQHDRGLFDRTHLRFYTWDGWVELLDRAGFRIEHTICSGVPVGLAFPRWEGTVAVRIMERLSFESARLWNKMFAYQFVVRARSVSAV
jgi:SAM-dependent methyltransferase